jgi:enoyl-CoA hydratase/carnithine racemase
MLHLDVEGTRRTLTIDNPERANALGPDDFAALDALLAKVESDEEATCLVVRGTGAHFSAGIDLALLAAMAEKATLEGIRALQRGFLRLATLEVPVIAAIDGACIGAGLELALACDLRLATAGARFSLPEVRYGVVADLGGLSLAPELLGTARALELALLADTLPADRAFAMGLVTEVVEDRVALEARVAERARVLDALTPATLRATKRVLLARRRERIKAELELAARENLALLAGRSPQAPTPP